MNNELARIWKEEVVDQVDILPRLFLEGLKKKKRYTSSGQSLQIQFHSGPPEYIPQVPTTKIRLFILFKNFSLQVFK